MGCCYPKLLKSKNVIRKDDGRVLRAFITGGLTLVRGNIQQNLPGGTLFITDKKLIHCTKFFGHHRIEFSLNKLKDLDSSLTFGSNCQVTLPCCLDRPDSYLVFKSDFDRKLHTIGIKVIDSDEVVCTIEKVIRRYSDISEKRASKIESTCSTYLDVA